jgi:flavin-dependent dehydrogenase
VLGVKARPLADHRAWPIPTSRRRLTDGHILYAGDAAGVVDPMTGEGIAQALETGIVAAEVIAGGGSNDEVAQRYERAVERRIGRDLRFAGMLHRILRSPLGARAAIRAAGASAWTRRNFARWMFEDYPRALLLTPDRWARGMLTPPGAFRA